MLYEVITKGQDSGWDSEPLERRTRVWRRTTYPQIDPARTGQNRFFLKSGCSFEILFWLLRNLYIIFTSTTPPLSRITSYNVCYTKLLRFQNAFLDVAEDDRNAKQFGL